MKVDFINSERVKVGDKELIFFMHPKHPDYQRAVAIVGEKGAQNLIKQFRDYLK